LVVGALLLLLFAHELGHLAVALLCRVPVAALNVGLGPPITAFELRRVRIIVRLFPLVAGVHYVPRQRAGIRCYELASPWRKSAVDLGGPLASYTTASAIVFVLARAGTLTTAVSGEPVPLRFGAATELALLVPWELTKNQWSALEQLLFHGETARLTGAVAAGRYLAAEATRGPAAFAAALALLSVAIGFFNLLPFPGLDGGKVLFHLVELARGRAIAPRLATTIQAASLSALVFSAALLVAAEVRFPLFSLLGAVAAPFMVGVSAGILWPGTPRIRWQRVVAWSALVGALIGLVASARLGLFGFALAIVATAIVVLLFAIATYGYRLSAAWILRSLPARRA
jgi:membrane-associated protease RseP (regulator of RpoE activity)